jgi:hypothetical protein
LEKFATIFLLALNLLNSSVDTAFSNASQAISHAWMIFPQSFPVQHGSRNRRLFRKYLDENLQPESILVFLHDPLSDHYRLSLARMERYLLILFSCRQPLPCRTGKTIAPLIIAEGDTLPADCWRKKPGWP